MQDILALRPGKYERTTKHGDTHSLVIHADGTATFCYNDQARNGQLQVAYDTVMELKGEQYILIFLEEDPEIWNPFVKVEEGLAKGT